MSPMSPAPARRCAGWRALAARRAAGRRGVRAGDARQNRRPEPVEGRRLRDVLHDRRRRPPARAGVRERARAIGGDRHRAVARGRGAACGGAAHATPSSRGWRAASSNASAGIAARWTPCASRRGASTTRPARWRRPLVSCAISSTVWTRLLRPARDEDGVPDSVLTLTAIILLLRPLDVWWVAPFVLAAACLSLVVRAVRRAPITWLLVAVLVAARIVVRLAALRQPHLPARLLVPGDRAGALGPSARGDAVGEQPMAARRRLRDGGDVEGGAVAGLHRRPLLQGDAADRRAVCRCVAGVRRAVARSDGREPHVPRAAAGRRRAAHIRRRSSSRRGCARSPRSPPGADCCSKR